MRKHLITGIIIGIILGATGSAGAKSDLDAYIRNGVLCTPTGSGPSRGIVCTVQGQSDYMKRIAIVNQRQIIVGRGNGVVYYGPSR